MAKRTGYYTTPLSDNLEETPEGFLIARDVVIGRTGWQTYKVGELPESAADLGVDMSNPQANIEVYRDAAHVFDYDTICSFEGKPVTDDHPQEFVDPDNFKRFAMGHVQNVRKGTWLLDSGDTPLIGDIHITAEPLLSKVKNGIKREVSCGYDYGILKDGDRILQVDITGNHVAVVPKGRAGSEARINDAAPEDSTVATPTTTHHQPVMEKQPVKITLRHLLGLGVKALATDASSTPEQLAEAASAIAEHQEPVATSEDRVAADGRATDARAKARDARRAALHKALDERLDGEEAEVPMEDNHTRDVDMSELESMGCADEEEEGAVDEDPDEGGIGEETEESGEEVEEGGDARATDRARAADAHGQGALAALRALRPVIARTNDKAVQKAFNTAISAVNKRSRATAGDYSTVTRAARARNADAKKSISRGRAADGVHTAAPDRNAKLQAAYDEARKGGK